MPEEIPTNQPIPEGVVEVKEPVLKEGRVKFLNKKAFNNPAPTYVKLIVKTIQASCVGLITLVGGTDIFTGGQSKRIVFVLGAIAIVSESIMKATGVVSEKE